MSDNCIPLRSRLGETAQEAAFKRLLLEDLVTSFASTFIARVMSGKGREASQKFKGFLSEKAENAQLFDEVIAAAKLNCTASEFADLADENEALMNGDSDSELIEKANQLKAAGAVRLLRDDLRWQCSIIENIEALLRCLNESS